MNTIRTSSGDAISAEGGPIGLALSGSGLKASLFHIGVLAYLADLDLLRRIDVISGTSGGALIAALYHLRLKRALDAQGDVDSGHLIRMVSALEQDFLATAQTDLQARLFANPFLNLKRLSAHHSSAVRLGDLLEQHLFRPVWAGEPDQPIEMRELKVHPRGDRDFNPVTDNSKRYCKAPVLIINAANQRSGRAWRFDAEGMGEPCSGPTAQRLSKAPLLARTSYRRLTEAYAGMTLGHAVAASMATPGLLEPLSLPRLYPDPERPSRFLDVRLGDGCLADALGTEALIERGCRRMIVADAGGLDPVQQPGSPASDDRVRALQLKTLEAQRPGDVVLVQMLSEVEMPDVKPQGPMNRGHVASDRHDDDVTSYGVHRGLQKLIAGMRRDLDAPSEIEAMSLMADGYLITRRTLQRHRQRGHGWVDDLAPKLTAWRFDAMVEALRQPSKKLIRHLRAAGSSWFAPSRLTAGQVFLASALALTGMLALIAFGIAWSAVQAPTGSERAWFVPIASLLTLAAWLAGRYGGKDQKTGIKTGRLNRMFGWLGWLRIIAMALPLALKARFRGLVARAFVRSGQLKRIGIEPVKPGKHDRRRPAQPEIDDENPRKAA